jgi:peptidoglycan-N-acetylglucosamine deacetylase
MTSPRLGVLIALSYCAPALVAYNAVSPWQLPKSRPVVARRQPVEAPFRLVPERIPARFRGRMITQRPAALSVRVIALTFDDGPNPHVTPQVLKTLREYDALATFFVVGVASKQYPALLTEVARDGHAIESHSYSHPEEEVSEQHAARELDRTRSVIACYGGRFPTLFRPPYGNMGRNLSRVAGREGACVVKWTICGNDSPRLTTAEIVDAATRHPQSGDIILLHDGRDRYQTARALPEILRRLNAAGFRFVTVPELLRLWDEALSRSEKLRRPRSHGHPR